ncbi:hypothetical protein Bbelb_372520 [Branchiostoma belcheri]|nr:hypothetical protein Bbelb_372520 [Branchiostoma belcheri]
MTARIAVETHPPFSSGVCDVIAAGNTCQVPQRKHRNGKDALLGERGKETIPVGFSPEDWKYLKDLSVSKVLRRQSPDCYGTGEIGLTLFEFLSPIATLFLPVPNMIENYCEDPPILYLVQVCHRTRRVPENRCEDPPTFSSDFCDVIAAGNTFHKETRQS